MKKPMLLEEHRKLGGELKTLDAAITAQICRNAFPKQHAVSKALERASKSLLHLRSELDNIACRDFPGSDPTGLYF